MLLTKKNYRKIAEELEFLNRGLPDWEQNPIIGLGKKCEIYELAKLLKEKIDKFGLEIVLPKNAKMVCVAYTQYPDKEGYDVFGFSCFIGNPEKINYKIRYCGLCGDVNTIDVTSQKHVKFFVR